MLNLIFVKPLGSVGDKKKYALYFSEHPEDAWGPNWDFINPSICGDVSPDTSVYSDMVEIISKIPLKTAQETACHSMEDATKKIIALSWVNIDEMESYPEDGRMVLHFGDSKEDVLQLLEKNSRNVEIVS